MAIALPIDGTLPAPSDNAIQQDSVRLVYRQTGAGLIGHFLGWVVCTMVYWEDVPHPVLWGWTIAFGLLWTARFAGLLSYERAVLQGRVEPAHWLRLWNLGAVVGASLWSVAGILFYGHGGAFERTVLMLTIYSFAIGAVPYMASQTRLFLTCMGLYFIPMIARTALQGGPNDLQLAGVWCLMCLCTLALGRAFRNMFGEMVSLRLHAQDLAQKLHGEMQAAEAAQRDAETANRAKTQFFAAASHDLRQPLHVMMLLSSALKPSIGTDDGLTLLKKLQTALGSLSHMFEKMFFVARIDAQRVDYRAQALPLADLWARLDSEFSVLCQSQGLTWRLDATQEWAQTDGHVLERILRNLLNNAVRYTEHGEVRLRARKRGPWVFCQVWDTGVGIQRQHRHRIFDDYFQAHNDGRLSSEGLGLGLAVVRRLSQLGPTPVSVLSRPGRGTCFSVRLPRLIPAEVITPDEAPAPAPAGATPQRAVAKVPERQGRGVVVLVEDDPQVRDSTALVLQQDGWQVAGAPTPDAALALVAQMQEDGRMPEGEMPAALVSDHRLGLRINGLEALEQLRYEFGDDLPAFLLTGEATAGLDESAARARVQVLHKPVSAEHLLQMLAESTADAA